MISRIAESSSLLLVTEDLSSNWMILRQRLTLPTASLSSMTSLSPATSIEKDLHQTIQRKTKRGVKMVAKEDYWLVVEGNALQGVYGPNLVVRDLLSGTTTLL